MSLGQRAQARYQCSDSQLYQPSTPWPNQQRRLEGTNGCRNNSFGLHVPSVPAKVVAKEILPVSRKQRQGSCGTCDPKMSFWTYRVHDMEMEAPLF